MKAYRVVGTFPNGKRIQEFTQDVVAVDENDALHRVLSTLGSRHRASRRAIKVTTIEAIDPSTSTEAKVISAFRDGGKPARATSTATSEEE